MAGKLRISAKLASACWEVLRADKELLLFPVFSAVTSLLAVTAVALPTILSEVARTSVPEEQLIASEPQAPGFLLMVAVTGLVVFVSTFFNAALVSAALERLAGGDPTIRSGLRAATWRLDRIIGWSIISTIAHLVIRGLEERLGWLARITLGTLWSVVSFLVLPIILFEDIPSTEALGRSAKLLRSTWGQNLGIHVGLHTLTLFALAPLVAFPFCGILAVNTIGFPAFLFYPVLGGLLLWTVLVLVASSALTGVFRAALYRYAVDARHHGHSQGHHHTLCAPVTGYQPLSGLPPATSNNPMAPAVAHQPDSTSSNKDAPKKARITKATAVANVPSECVLLPMMFVLPLTRGV